jgi:acyl carrier protein
MTAAVEETLRRYLVDELGLPESVTVDSPVMENGLLVSAQLIDVIVFLEDTFGVVLRPVDVVPEKMKSIASIAAIVRERMGAASGSPS